MSFGINGPKHIPGIQEAQSMKNNGGGGNLGYFKRQKKEDEKKKKDELDIFKSSDEDKDVFIPEDNNANDESLLKKASEFIKQFKVKRNKA